MKIISFFIVILLPLIGLFQQTVELNIGAGYTLINIEGVVDIDENTGSFATDWNQANYSVGCQYFFIVIGILILEQN